jgi:hypothetical protein
MVFSGGEVRGLAFFDTTGVFGFVFSGGAFATGLGGRLNWGRFRSIFLTDF